MDILLATVLAAIGTFFLCSGAFGYLKVAVNIPGRLLFLAGGLLLLLPGSSTDLIGAACLAGGLVVALVPPLMRRRSGKPTTSGL